jgi:hypothetical protein
MTVKAAPSNMNTYTSEPIYPGGRKDVSLGYYWKRTDFGDARTTSE